MNLNSRWQKKSCLRMLAFFGRELTSFRGLSSLAFPYITHDFFWLTGVATLVAI